MKSRLLTYIAFLLILFQPILHLKTSSILSFVLLVNNPSKCKSSLTGTCNYYLKLPILELLSLLSLAFQMTFSFPLHYNFLLPVIFVRDFIMWVNFDKISIKVAKPQNYWNSYLFLDSSCSFTSFILIRLTLILVCSFLV